MERLILLERLSDEIAIVKLNDTKTNNALHKKMRAELVSVIKKLGEDEKLRVVILSNTGNYFCIGADSSVLEEFYSGEYSSKESGLLKSIMDFPLPIISAVTGHCLGGGFCLALMADMGVLAKESRYGFTYMNYGITPGAGATFLAPYKLGESLANELLYSGELVSGEHLKQRGVSMEVLDKDIVLKKAVRLATAISTKPRSSIILLKKNQNSRVFAKLTHAIDQENEMHKYTLVGNDYVLKMIDKVRLSEKELIAPELKNASSI